MGFSVVAGTGIELFFEAGIETAFFFVTDEFDDLFNSVVGVEQVILAVLELDLREQIPIGRVGMFVNQRR